MEPLTRSLSLSPGKESKVPFLLECDPIERGYRIKSIADFQKKGNAKSGDTSSKRSPAKRSPKLTSFLPKEITLCTAFSLGFSTDYCLITVAQLCEKTPATRKNG